MIRINQKNLDAYLEAVLDAYKSDKISWMQARNDIANALTMAALDNLDGFRQYILVVSFKQRWQIE